MLKYDKLFIIGALTVLILVVGSIAYLASAPKIGECFTEFFVLGANGMLADYPVNMTLGQNGTVILGITNHEYTDLVYKIQVTLQNQPLSAIENIQLSNGGTWRQTYTFKPSQTSDRMDLEFTLYKGTSAQAYQNLRLWITVR